MKSHKEELIESKPYLKPYMDYFGNEGPGKDVEAILALLNDGRDYEGEEERKENENRCPHCNKPLQIHDAVLVKTSRSVHVDYHRTHIGPGWRERSTYKNYEIEYYRCQECDYKIRSMTTQSHGPKSSVFFGA